MAEGFASKKKGISRCIMLPQKLTFKPPPIYLYALSLQVLQNDVSAHKATVETVNKAGNDLVESSAGEEASGLQSKLENLNQRWKAIQEKTGQRKQQLQSALLQV